MKFKGCDVLVWLFNGFSSVCSKNRRENTRLWLEMIARNEQVMGLRCILGIPKWVSPSIKMADFLS